jgi:hypothetical protein
MVTNNQGAAQVRWTEEGGCNVNRSRAENLALAYVESWQTGDSARLASMLDPACMLIEGDGQVFRGAERIVDELDKRVAGAYGPWRIVGWEVTALIFADESCAFEWVFDGQRSHAVHVEGASVMRFSGDRIGHVREYCATASLWEADVE